MLKAISLTGILLWGGLCSATIIHVPLEQPTIQTGIDAAMSGDTVLVAPGTYVENIDMNGNNILLISANGRDVTIIEPADPNTNIVTIAYGEDTTCIIDGFTIRNTSNAYGIYCDGTAPIVRNCDVSFCNRTNDGAGIFCKHSGARIENCLIHDNVGSETGGGVFFYGSHSIILQIVSNKIYDNTSPNGTGIGSTSSNGAIIARNVLWGNDSPGGTYCGAIYVKSNVSIVNNTIVGNSDGVTILGGTNVDVRNNIIVSNAAQGLVPDDATYDYNDVWDNGSENIIGPNGISADPLFTIPYLNVYSLAWGSPCIDAGDPDAQYDDPDFTRNDIGALTSLRNFPHPYNINLGDEDINHVINHTPTFYWTYFDSAATTQTAYEVQVGDDDDWAVADKWSSGFVSTSDTFSVYAGSLLYNGNTFYCRIRLTTGWRIGSWYQIQFTMNSAPNPPTPITPIDIDKVHFENARLFILNSYELQGDSVTYDFEIYYDADLTQLVTTIENVGEQDSITRTDAVPGLLQSVNYWWRARGYDQLEYGEWSQAVKFRTRYLPTTVYVPDDFAFIAAAVGMCADGYTIMLSPGTYTGLLNCNIDFGGRNALLTGEGGSQSTIIDCEGSGESHRRGFHFHSGEDSTTVISGITVTGAYADPGGGVLCEEASSPKFVNCVFSENSMVYLWGTGGAVACRGGSSPNFEDCLFEDNAAWGGGAISANGGNLKLTDCSFISNSYQAIMLFECSAQFENCDFRNHGAMGAAAINCDRSSLTVTNSLFENNYAAYGDGGAVYITWYSTAVFDSCTFSNNYAIWQGGAIYTEWEADLLVSNSTFIMNAADGESMHNPPWDSLHGGSIYASGPDVQLENCIFAYGTNGTAIRGDATLVCCDIYGNNDGDWEGSIADQLGINGNISLDPMFCDTTDQLMDLRIDPESPCAPPNNDCAILMGAWPVGCEMICGDADRSGDVDIDDAVYLINYIFGGGPPPIPIESGDTDCSGDTDIDDVVYLINFIFGGGYAPCDPDGDGEPDC